MVVIDFVLLRIDNCRLIQNSFMKNKRNVIIYSLFLISLLISSCGDDIKEPLRTETDVIATVMEGPSDAPCNFFINYGTPHFPLNLPDSMKINMQNIRITFEYVEEDRECVYTNGNISETEILPIINILEIEKL
jgi:hypothetical protein